MEARHTGTLSFEGMTVAQLQTQLAKRQDWMRINARRKVAMARAISAEIQVIRAALQSK